MFNIDFNNIVQIILPIALRQSKWVTWLKALIKPVKELFATFSTYRIDTLKKVNATGQVIYLEKMLNDAFDPMSSRIYISDSDAPRQSVYLFNKSEGMDPIYIFNKSEGMDPIYIFNKSEFENNDDFIVNIPDSIIPLPILSEVKVIIERYRPAGKRYSVNYYTITT